MDKYSDTLNNNLVEILEQEYNLYKKLNALADKKKEAIVENDVDKLSQLLEKDNDIIEDLEQLEKKRDELSGKISEELNIDQKELKFKELIEKMETSWQNKFKDIREDLLKVIDSLHQQNEQNKELVEEAMKINQFTVNVVHKLMEPENTYNVNKKSEDAANVNHLVDRKG